MDIVVNHTADVIQYRECQRTTSCSYRSRAEYPYTRLHGTGGEPINDGFAGDATGTIVNFAHLTDPRYAYTPFVPGDEAHIKVPTWLNNPIHYHNRGNSTFMGESSTMGDFFGLDDLMTESPQVIAGMIDIYGGWIDRFGVDGFRIDTARHVDPAFWRAFVPAMVARAKANGIPNFHIFGEVAEHSLDPGILAEHTRVDHLPAVLDFAFRQAVIDTVAGTRGTDAWATVFDGDALYTKGFDTAITLPTFTGNHDDGRFSTFARRAFPEASDDEITRRVMLANAMMLLLRGVPTIYAGDEQGFVGDGGDQDAREDMFASKVASYKDNHLLGTRTTTAGSHFTQGHVLFRQIQSLSELRRSQSALRRGRQIVRATSEEPGLLAVSRFDPNSNNETVLAFNTSTATIQRHVQVETTSIVFRSIVGRCPFRTAAPGTIDLTLPSLGYAVCAVK